MYSATQLKTLVSCGRDRAHPLPLRRGFVLVPLILKHQREQIHDQIAALQQSNIIAEQILATEQKRLELDENERAEPAAELERVRHLRNLLAEANLELDGLRADLDGRPTRLVAQQHRNLYRSYET